MCQGAIPLLTGRVPNLQLDLSIIMCYISVIIHMSKLMAQLAVYLLRTGVTIFTIHRRRAALKIPSLTGICGYPNIITCHITAIMTWFTSLLSNGKRTHSQES